MKNIKEYRTLKVRMENFQSRRYSSGLPRYKKMKNWCCCNSSLDVSAQHKMVRIVTTRKFQSRRYSSGLPSYKKIKNFCCCNSSLDVSAQHKMVRIVTTHSLPPFLATTVLGTSRRSVPAMEQIQRPDQWVKTAGI